MHKLCDTFPAIVFAVVSGSAVLSAQISTTTTLASSSNPASFGQPVMLTATISPAPGAGSVMFYDGTTVLGTKAVTSGQASLTTSLGLIVYSS
jgi:hypothetical protein